MSMTMWEDFEIQCTDYLNKRFGAYARFIHQGGNDSTISDILVQTKSGNSFYIDAKHSPAQCGQFVLLPDIKTNTFEYSERNVNRMNAYTRKIIAHMDFQGVEINMKSVNCRTLIMLMLFFRSGKKRMYQEFQIRNLSVF